MKNIPYGHQYICERDIGEVTSALRSDWLTQGPRIKKFEEALCKKTGAKYAVVVSSGTAALHIACLASGIKPGDEVITSPITFVASSNCILYCGGKVVFADIENDTINVDPGKIARMVTKATKAIIPVHFAGQPCRMEKIRAISRKHGLTVIEDAAHALGAKYKIGGKWVSVGSCRHSDMAVLSFHPVKHITTGEGGAVLTNEQNIYEKLCLLRSHGITKAREQFIGTEEGGWYYEMQCLGYNYRMTDFQCALGMSQLNKIDLFNERRRNIAERYCEAFKGIEGLKFIIEREGVKSSWHIFVLMVTDGRKRLYEKLRASGIGVNVHYRPVYLQPYYQRLGFRPGSCPNAESYYSKAVTIPLYPDMTDRQVSYVISKVKKAIGA
mgnify:CR=1 FL=1